MESWEKARSKSTMRECVTSNRIYYSRYSRIPYSGVCIQGLMREKPADVQIFLTASYHVLYCLFILSMIGRNRKWACKYKLAFMPSTNPYSISCSILSVYCSFQLLCQNSGFFCYEHAIDQRYWNMVLPEHECIPTGVTQCHAQRSYIKCSYT